MTTTLSHAPTVSSPIAPVPRLANGDHLTRDQFEERYEAMPNVQKAELIEGVVHMPTPVSYNDHGNPHLDLVTWLGTYRAGTPGIGGADNATVRLDMDNEPQPDALLMISPECGGQAHIDENGYVSGAPELVAEVAASSASYDLHEKLNAYRRNGVREYIVWRVQDESVDWFVLRGGQYLPLDIDDFGLYRSEALPGLWLDSSALVRRDLTEVLKRLQEGIASKEHLEFASRMGASELRQSTS